MIELAVKDLLAASPDLAALISDRIYPTFLPQGCQLPAVTYQVISSVPEYSHDGEGLIETRIQVSCWANTAITSWRIAKQVKSILSAYTGVAAGEDIGSTFLANRTDLFESDTNTFQVAMDFLITHKEA